MRLPGKTTKTITISINEKNWSVLKSKKIRVSTLINQLIDDYLNKSQKVEDKRESKNETDR